MFKGKYMDVEYEEKWPDGMNKKVARRNGKKECVVHKWT